MFGEGAAGRRQTLPDVITALDIDSPKSHAAKPMARGGGGGKKTDSLPMSAISQRKKSLPGNAAVAVSGARLCPFALNAI